MNEIELSNDLPRIETEINFYKEQAGQSIWEIGRRLNHVKENDLAHGAFGEWLARINFSHDQANKMMRISAELNSESTRNLGIEALYLITTLPEEQKEEELKKAEEGNPSTVREIRKLKRQNRALEQQVEDKDKSIAQAQHSERIAIEQLEREQNKEPEVVTKEVLPADYEELKNFKAEAVKKISHLEQEKEQSKSQYEHLKAQRQEEDENSKKYKELTEAILEMEGRMDKTQKLIQKQKQVYELVDLSKELLQKITPIPYIVDQTYVAENEVVYRELNNISNQTQKFLDNLNDLLEETTIIEGEFTHG